MQTFLPLPSFENSAGSLDMRRLGKQRVETKQLVLALENPDYGWQHHPATQMWRGHREALCFYGRIICEEWRRRGYKDSLLPFFTERIAGQRIDDVNLPVWFGDKAFHASHRSNLARKMPEWYTERYGWTDLGLDYVWPVSRVEVTS